MRSAHQRTIIIAIAVLIAVILISWLVVRRMRREQEKRIAAPMHEIELLRKPATQEEKPQTEETQEDEKPEEEVPNEDRLFLMRVIETVNEGLADRQWSVEVVASKLNMSVQTFRRRLMAAAGETPKAFISAIQMEKAGKLLTEHPEIPVVDVAFRCGFEEASSFTHTFKRIYGMTPSQYREKQ